MKNILYFKNESNQIELNLEGNFLSKFCVGRDSVDIMYWDWLTERQRTYGALTKLQTERLTLTQDLWSTDWLTDTDTWLMEHWLIDWETDIDTVTDTEPGPTEHWPRDWLRLRQQAGVGHISLVWQKVLGEWSLSLPLLAARLGCKQTGTNLIVQNCQHRHRRIKHVRSFIIWTCPQVTFSSEVFKVCMSYYGLLSEHQNGRKSLLFCSCLLFPPCLLCHPLPASCPLQGQQAPYRDYSSSD